MAYFTDAQGARLSAKSFSLQVGEIKEIRLVDFRDPGGQDLFVDVTTGNGQACANLATLLQFKEAGNTRYYRIRGLQEGTGRVDAFLSSTAVKDSVPLTVGGSVSGLESLVESLDNGSLTINKGDAAVIRAAAGGSTTTLVDPQIVDLLNNLLTFGDLDVMSLLRRGQSQHGVVNGSVVTCKAVDIAGYRNAPVRLTPKDQAIRLVCSILQRFPAGKWDIGFPRPVGGAMGFSPKDDVFFSVPDQATAQLCWDGKISRTLDQMLDPAKEQVRMAMMGPGNFRTFYPDGLNHLHVSVSKHG